MQCNTRLRFLLVLAQSWASGGKYSNLFYNHLGLFNPLEKDVAIVKVKSEYEKDGEWIEMKTRYILPFGHLHSF